MAHPNAVRAVRAKLGHANAIGGARYVERTAFSDEVVGLQLAMDAAARKATHASINRALKKSRAAPPVKKLPSPNERTKIRWSDELIARFKQTAPWVKSNKALAVRLGFPEYCEGAMKMARSRYLRKAHATKMTPERRQIESPAADLPLAA